MLELYHFDNSVCSQKVRLALEEMRLEWQDRRSINIPNAWNLIA